MMLAFALLFLPSSLDPKVAAQQSSASTPSPTATPTPTATPDPSVILVETQCGSATALGASESSDRAGYDRILNIKYPKLGREAGSYSQFWNEIVQKYNAALAKGLSVEQAFEATYDRSSRNDGWGKVQEWYDRWVVKDPDSLFQHYRVRGVLEFHSPSNLDYDGAIKFLKDFLVSQGETKAPEVVFGDQIYFRPEDGNRLTIIADIEIPLNMAGPLSELPEVRRLKLYEIPEVYPE